VGRWPRSLASCASSARGRRGAKPEVVVVVTVLGLISGSRTVAAIAGVVGLIWLAVTWRSGIYTTADGIDIRGLARTVHLRWPDVDAFLVVSQSGASRSLVSSRADYLSTTARGPGPEVVGLDPNLVEASAVAHRTRMLSSIVVVTKRGERIKTRGTASTILDPNFPIRAATALNSELLKHNPAATGGGAAVN